MEGHDFFTNLYTTERSETAAEESCDMEKKEEETDRMRETRAHCCNKIGSANFIL